MATYYVAARNGESIEGKTLHENPECQHLQNSDATTRPVSDTAVDEAEAELCGSCVSLGNDSGQESNAGDGGEGETDAEETEETAEADDSDGEDTEDS